MIGDKIEACPECDSHNIRQRQPACRDTGTTKSYRCTICTHSFDDPIIRPKLAAGPKAESILKRLGVDPEEQL